MRGHKYTLYGGVGQYTQNVLRQGGFCLHADLEYEQGVKLGWPWGLWGEAEGKGKGGVRVAAGPSAGGGAVPAGLKRDLFLCLTAQPPDSSAAPKGLLEARRFRRREGGVGRRHRMGLATGQGGTPFPCLSKTSPRSSGATLFQPEFIFIGVQIGLIGPSPA